MCINTRAARQGGRGGAHMKLVARGSVRFLDSVCGEQEVQGFASLHASE